MSQRRMHVLVAATNPMGEPELVGIVVLATAAQVERQQHYAVARDGVVQQLDFTDPVWATDQDGPDAPLLQHFVWESFTVVDLSQTLEGA